MEKQVRSSKGRDLWSLRDSHAVLEVVMSSARKRHVHARILSEGKEKNTGGVNMFRKKSKEKDGSYI